MTTSTFEYGCLWPVDPACLTDDWEALSEEVQNRALALASSSLHRLVGYRVGNCPVVVRPQPNTGRCFVPWTGSWDGGPFRPGVNRYGQWLNACGIDREASGCEVVLPAPVGRVDEVKVDGVVLDEADYRIDNGNILVWQGGGDCPFPASQDLNLPDTEPGTFSVTYLNAYPVDGLGAYAVGILALEFAKACSGRGKCRLPDTVTSVVRQGVSFEITPGAFPNGLTGIREVDAYIGLWNPRGIKQPTTVWTP